MISDQQTMTNVASDTEVLRELGRVMLDLDLTKQSLPNVAKALETLGDMPNYPKPCIGWVALLTAILDLKVATGIIDAVDWDTFQRTVTRIKVRLLIMHNQGTLGHEHAYLWDVNDPTVRAVLTAHSISVPNEAQTHGDCRKRAHRIRRKSDKTAE